MKTSPPFCFRTNLSDSILKVGGPRLPINRSAVLVLVPIASEIIAYKSSFLTRYRNAGPWCPGMRFVIMRQDAIKCFAEFNEKILEYVRPRKVAEVRQLTLCWRVITYRFIPLRVDTINLRVWHIVITW